MHNGCGDRCCWTFRPGAVALLWRSAVSFDLAGRVCSIAVCSLLIYGCTGTGLMALQLLRLGRTVGFWRGDQQGASINPHRRSAPPLCSVVCVSYVCACAGCFHPLSCSLVCHANVITSSSSSRVCVCCVPSPCKQVCKEELLRWCVQQSETSTRLPSPADAAHSLKFRNVAYLRREYEKALAEGGPQQQQAHQQQHQLQRRRQQQPKRQEQTEHPDDEEGWSGVGWTRNENEREE